MVSDLVTDEGRAGAGQVPAKEADRKPDHQCWEMEREYEHWLRTLTGDEHRVALGKYLELQDHFPELRMVEAYIRAARVVRHRRMGICKSHARHSSAALVAGPGTAYCSPI